MASVRIIAVAASVAVYAATSLAAGGAQDGASAVFGVELPAGYRDWPVISVAHETGSLNDLRVIVGNEIAMRAVRDGTGAFPDGAVIARLAWKYVPSEEDNAAFGQVQSFVAGPPTNVQVSVKDSVRYAASGGWGFGQFEGGRPNRDAALLGTCAPCHAGARRDFVFTHYAP